MADTITVLFHENYFSNQEGVAMFEKGEEYEIAADFPIPSRDVTILEGKSTYKKPAPPKKNAAELAQDAEERRQKRQVEKHIAAKKKKTPVGVKKK